MDKSLKLTPIYCSECRNFIGYKETFSNFIIKDICCDKCGEIVIRKPKED